MFLEGKGHGVDFARPFAILKVDVNTLWFLEASFEFDLEKIFVLFDFWAFVELFDTSRSAMCILGVDVVTCLVI